MPVVTTHSDGVPVTAYCLLDRAGRTLAERNADTVFYAASTVKLGVMLAAVFAAQTGELSLEEELVCRRSFRSAVAGAPDFPVDPDDVDERFPEDGVRESIAELVGMMICRSSNEATNVLFERVGPARIADAFAWCGTRSTLMQRPYGDTVAAAAGLKNETSARDLAVVIRAVTTGRGAVVSERQEISDPHLRWSRRLLAGQEHRRIALALPDGVPWGSKSGDVPGIEHDVAYLGDPGAPPDAPGPRFLAICTRGFEPEQGREAIVSLASALLR